MRSAVFLALATLTVAVQGEHCKHHYHHDADDGDAADNADAYLIFVTGGACVNFVCLV